MSITQGVAGTTLDAPADITVFAYSLRQQRKRNRHS